MSYGWFCGITQSGRERLAKLNLANQGFDTYMPMCIEEWGTKPRLRPFLIGYVFIGLDPDRQSWREVFSTYGMRSMICSGEKPQVVGSWIIDEIKAREVDGIVRLPPKVQCKFRKGDMVQVKGSPLQMVFEEPKDQRRAEVFIKLLGSTFKTVVPLSKLTAAPFAQTASG